MVTALDTIVRIVMAGAQELNGKLKIIILLTGILGVLVGVSASAILGTIPIYSRLSKVETSMDFVTGEMKEVKAEMKEIRKEFMTHDKNGGE